jgi:hypothetical protein
MKMKLAKWVFSVLAASLLALTGTQANAQSRSSSGAEPPTVPDLVADAYRWGDFAELERLYAIYGKAGVRSELTGHPRVDHFWMGIGMINDSSLRVTDDYYEQLDALTKRWALDHPRSVLAQLLYASTLETRAWVYRGNGYAHTVSPAGWAGFRKYRDLALAQLQRTEAMAANDSSWNEIALRVGRSLDWDKARLMAVFQRGIAKNPDHDTLYFSMLTALLPKWGGDLEGIDRFIALADRNTRERRDLQMYARLYAALSYEELDQALFTSSRASWTGMKEGFEDLLKRYPHVDHRNMYAYFACMADDRQVLREQLQSIGDTFVRKFWGGNADRTFEACRRMAAQL